MTLIDRANPFHSDFARRHFERGRAAGRAKGRATAVLTVLTARGIEVSSDVHARVMACADHDQLDAWLRRAATADRLADVFDE